MFNFDTTDFQRIAVSSTGALLLSAACVLGAVSPVRAAEVNAPLTVSDWQADVGRQIDAELRTPATFRGNSAITTVAIRLDAGGALASAKVAQSSGSGAIDREAIRVANRIAYPALPAGLRGEPQTVMMQVYFGTAAGTDTAAHQQRAMERLAATKKAKRIETAALPIG